MGELSYTVGGDSNLISFKSAARVPITSLKAHFKPKQDLHGYSKPWPGGGGKNIIGNSFTTGKTINMNGEIITNTGGMITDYISVFSVSYVWSGINKYTDNQWNYRVHGYDENKDWVEQITYQTVNKDASYNIVFTPNDNIKYIRLSFNEQTNNNQIEQGSTSTSYEPYENICPGTGWNEYEIYKTSYNIFDEEYEDGGLNDSTGSNYPDSSFIRSKNYIPCRPNTSYCFSYTHAEQYNANLHVYYYDINKQHIRNTWITPKQVVTSHSRAYYMRFYMDSAYKRNGLRDVSINYPSIDTQYHAYCGEHVPVVFPIMGKNKFNVSTRYQVNFLEYNETTNFFINDTEDTRDAFEIYCEGWNDDTRIGMLFLRYNTPTGYFTTTFTVNDAFKDMNCIRFKHNGSKRDFSMKIPISLVVGQTYTFSMEVTGNDPTTIGGVSFGNIQIEFGDTATEYEPYSSDNTVYGGYVDAAKGEIYVTHVKTIIDGRYDFGTPNDYNTYYRFFRPYSSVGFLKPKYGTYPIANWLAQVANIDGIYIGSTGNVLLYINKKLNISNNSQLSNYLNEHPLEVIYELDSPQIYPMSSIKLTSFIGHNVFYTNTNSKTQLSYAIHDTAPIRAAKYRIAANEPHVETIESSIAHFKTDMITPLKECKVYFTPKQDTNGYGKVWIGGCGKNLWNNDSVIYNTWTANDGTASVNSYGCRTQDIEVVPGDTYTVFFNGEKPYSASIIELDENKNFITRTHQNWSAYSSPSALTVTMGVNTKYCYAQTYSNSDNGMTFALLNTYKIQLEKASVATSYEPYENVCPIEGFTGITTYKSKKNLLPDGSFTRTYSDHGVIMEYSDGALHIQCDGTSTANYVFLSLPDTFSTYLSSGTYTLSGGTNKYRVGAITVYVLVNNLDIEFKSSDENSVTKTINGGTIKLQVAIKPTIPMDITIYPQLELGSAATEYEPYNGETIPIIWGKNLLNVSNETVVPFEISGYENYTLGNGSVSVTDYALVGFKVKCEPSTQYTFSYTSTAQFNMEVAAYTEEPTVIRNSSNFIAQGNAQSKTFITPADAKWLTCGFYVLQSQAGSGITINNLQLELGSSKTDYVPYICGTVYSGYVDLNAGKIIQTHKLVTLDGTEYGWSTYGAIERNDFCAVLQLTDKKIGYQTSICNKIQNVDSCFAPYAYKSGRYCDHTSNKYIYICMPNNDITSLSDFKTWLAYNPMQLCYELETPIEHALTPIQLKTLRGQNNIWSNTNGPVEVSYWAH